MEIEKGPLTFIPPKLSVKLITQYVEITLDRKLFSTGGGNGNGTTLQQQWQAAIGQRTAASVILSRSCQRLSSKLPVGHKKNWEKSHFYPYTVERTDRSVYCEKNRKSLNQWFFKIF